MPSAPQRTCRRLTHRPAGTPWLPSVDQSDATSHASLNSSKRIQVLPTSLSALCGEAACNYSAGSLPCSTVYLLLDVSCAAQGHQRHQKQRQHVNAHSFSSLERFQCFPKQESCSSLQARAVWDNTHDVMQHARNTPVHQALLEQSGKDTEYIKTILSDCGISAGRAPPCRSSAR